VIESPLREEVIALARDLIRIDTSNPPGNETAAAAVLADYLRGAGLEPELVGPDPERLNLVARIPGAGEGPSIMLMGHTDVVPAPTADWTVPPFEARVRDGELVGRGAVDMKNELAARAVAFAAFARSGERPAGDIILLAESDEERNTADVGMSWLVRERPELVRCDYALNEGGGELLELSDGRRVVTVAVGEKQVSSVRIRVFGRAGHASLPGRADNPVRHAAAAAGRLLDAVAPVVTVPAVERALATLGAPPPDGPGFGAWGSGLHPLLGDLLPAMVRLTVTPTGLQTFEPANVIPPYADIVCDCRAVPGQGIEEIEAHVGAAIGGAVRYELELLEPLEGGTESPTGTALYEAIEAYVEERLPGAMLLPVISTGFNDSHWVRGAFDTIAYGFAPIFATDPVRYARAMHGADEAIALDDLVEIAELSLSALRRLCGRAAA
jgi:acetylornithine deacetylase/succinyl-diaminopimelate desuccinylase-like protein